MRRNTALLLRTASVIYVYVNYLAVYAGALSCISEVWDSLNLKFAPDKGANLFIGNYGKIFN